MYDFGLHTALDESFRYLQQAREAFAPPLLAREIGRINSVATGIARVTGLPNVGFEELVKFPGGLYGIAFDLGETDIGVVLLDNYWHLQAGDEVERTGRVMDVPVGNAVLGRVINPLGAALDGLGALDCVERLPIERPAASIMDRSPVSVPLQTGIKVIDALIPIGRGQRELILGDRQTGKTTIAVDTILNQHDQNILCVYCAIGQRASAVAKVIATLRQHGAMAYTTVVVTEGNDPAGMTCLAPYAATSIAEYFMQQGHDVLIVYERPHQSCPCLPRTVVTVAATTGAGSVSGDVFYIHSRLLERSTHLRTAFGGGSLTALPIVKPKRRICRPTFPPT